jgi:hypothetical protein
LHPTGSQPYLKPGTINFPYPKKIGNAVSPSYEAGNGRFFLAARTFLTTTSVYGN